MSGVSNKPKSILEAIYFGIKSLFITRVIDRPKNKSGQNVLAIVENSEYRGLKHSNKFVFPNSYSRFKKVFNKKSDLLILVDDFVGTGDTANTVLNHFFKAKNFNSQNTVVLSLISLKLGVENVFKSKGVKVFQAYTRERAISDFYTDKQVVQENINKVQLMENSLNCEEELSLGYKKSQALLSIMNKSPNNTLPVFWHETKNIPAPFPRRKIFNR